MSKEITNEQLFELMTIMYTKIEEVNNKLDNKADKTDIIRLEDKLETKTKVLFDGYSQLYEKTASIEEKLDNQDDIIFRRVK